MTTPSADPAPQASPLASPDPWNLVAKAYAGEAVSLFERYAQEALRRAQVGDGMHVVDVAAGPGTLSFLAARAGATVSAIDFSADMISELRGRAQTADVTSIEAQVGDGTALPYGDETFDAGFSMFGLMFFPDRAAGFRELHRVLKPGAKAVVSSWVPMDRVPLMAGAMEILGDLLPGPKPPPRGLPLADPDTCFREMSGEGFREVDVNEHAATLEVPSTTAMVDSFSRTNVIVALAKRRLGDGWGEVRDALERRLIERFGEGPHEMTMTAYLSVGTR